MGLESTGRVYTEEGGEASASGTETWAQGPEAGDLKTRDQSARQEETCE